MQRVKHRFHNPDGGHHGSLQSCLRTGDLELVGDGRHLSYFEMLGNFSFGGNDYELSVELWHSLLRDWSLPELRVHVHPSQPIHEQLWRRRGYDIQYDTDCTWSDGEISGYCCEIYVGELEIGNLVQPQQHSTDVGFGWERLCQVIEGRRRVDQTTLFNQNLHPVVSDHSRAIQVLLENGVEPGNRGRQYVCRRLLRRILRYPTDSCVLPFSELLKEEQRLRDQAIRNGRRVWRKHKHKPSRFWWETFGILPDEIGLLSND